ncbi:ATP-binding protein [Malonomonas rubra]|uniref:ATP-binding protein n=1 Tax=Malonomonas rubra TaxID=57040 RepID=UPI0026F07835|nr:ATP-binding protein [Malonomonas rubra]
MGTKIGSQTDKSFIWNPIQTDIDIQQLLNNLHIAAISVDTDLRIRGVTSLAAKLLHLTPADIGKPFHKVATFFDDPDFIKDIKRVLTTSKIAEKELMLSNQRWFLARIVPEDSSTDSSAGIILNLIDISENKNHQKDLQESEKRLRALVSASSDVVYCMSPDWKEMNYLLSDDFLANTDHPDRDWLQNYIPEEEQPLVIETIEKAIRTKTPFDLEHRVQRKDNTIGWTSSRAVPILDENRNIREWFGMAKDITRPKRAEIKLLESEKRFRQLADAMPQLVWSSLVNGKIDYINKRSNEYLDLFQCSDGFWSWEAMIHPDDFEYTSKGWQKNLQSGNSYQIEHRCHCADGTYRWHLTRAVPVRNDQDHIYKWLGTTTDIDDLKQTEKDLANAREVAESAVKAKREFLANMTHEIRTPMTVILGALEHLDKTNLSEEESYCVKLAEKASRNLLEIIGDILDYSKIDAGRLELEKEPFSIRTCLEEVLKISSEAAENKGLELKLNISDQVPQVTIGDETRLRQIFFNLISNAIKFTEQGKITVTATRLSSTENEKSPGTLLFSVMDTGCGIPKDKMHLLFQSFTQIDSSSTRHFGGSGLGLAICRGLVEPMGGDIWVESEEGNGSEFLFTLPILLERRTIGRDMVAIEDCEILMTNKVRHILLAEDDPSIQEILKVLLDKPQWRVEIVDDGAAAVAAWQKGQFDLILMDIQMRGMDGLEATEKIRSLEQDEEHIPIVALTAQTRKETIENCFAVGMDDVLVKPARLEKIQQVIKHLCQ